MTIINLRSTIKPLDKEQGNVYWTRKRLSTILKENEEY